MGFKGKARDAEGIASAVSEISEFSTGTLCAMLLAHLVTRDYFVAFLMAEVARKSAFSFSG